MKGIYRGTAREGFDNTKSVVSSPPQLEELGASFDFIRFGVLDTMLFRRISVVTLLGCSLGVLGGRVQNPHLKLPPNAALHRAAAENIFLESYAAYKLVLSFMSCVGLVLTR